MRDLKFFLDMGEMFKVIFGEIFTFWLGQNCYFPSSDKLSACLFCLRNNSSLMDSSAGM